MLLDNDEKQKFTSWVGKFDVEWDQIRTLSLPIITYS